MENEHEPLESETSEETIADEGETVTEVVTETQAIIKIEGQEFEIEAALAQDDKLLKTILQPHFAAIENAQITREVTGGKLAVSIVKRAQHKG